jgi:hypothetical protein
VPGTKERGGPNNARDPSVENDVEKASILFELSGRGIYAHGLYKGLPQGSVLSPFMYNFYTRLVEACLHPLCSI